MKLSKLYSNSPNFKNIEFKLNGVNIIYADVITSIDDTRNSHSLGKSLLIKLLNFMFLAQVPKQAEHFLFKPKNEEGNPKFENHIFYLEILIDENKFLTIKRSVKQNTKISFNYSNVRTTKFTPPTSWDYENLPLETAKKQFIQYTQLDFFANKTYSYRKTISYSMRGQRDYASIYKLSKYNKGNHIDWKPFMFDLLGFNGKLLEQKYTLEKKKEGEKEKISILEKENNITVSRDEIVAQIEVREKEVKTIEIELDKFNFYSKDKQLIERSANEIESDISNLNTALYRLNYEISELKKSIISKSAFDLNKIEQLFAEAEVFFTENLKRTYDELLDFNHQITTERNKLLRQTIKRKELQKASIEEDLKELNNQKDKVLKYIKETSAFKKYKEYQKDQVKAEAQLLSLKEKLKAIDRIIELNENISTLNDNISDTVDRIKKQLNSTETNTTYKSIRNLFSDFFQNVFASNAVLTLDLNTKDNVEFNEPKIMDENGFKATSKGEGYTYAKVLAICFDLAVLCTYSNENYFHFVYHDDLLGNEDYGVKKRLLELVDKVSREYNLQYIYSAIKSDFPEDDDGNVISLSEDEIVLFLHDKDESGTLFGMSF